MACSHFPICRLGRIKTYLCSMRYYPLIFIFMQKQKRIISVRIYQTLIFMRVFGSSNNPDPSPNDYRDSDNSLPMTHPIEKGRNQSYLFWVLIDVFMRILWLDGKIHDSG